jgi:hypothetical protein
VSISVVGMMMEPGSGFDNFDANEIKVKLIIEISKQMSHPLRLSVQFEIRPIRMRLA